MTLSINGKTYEAGELIAYVNRLEKENAELKAELKAIDEAGELARKQITESFRNKKPYWELEKENAELKEQNRKLLESCEGAKEILAKLLEEEKNNMYWEMNGSDKSSYYEVRKQAKQFLKENSTYERIQKAKYNYTD